MAIPTDAKINHPDNKIRDEQERSGLNVAEGEMKGGRSGSFVPSPSFYLPDNQHAMTIHQPLLLFTVVD